MNLFDAIILRRQARFFRKNLAGCAFAAYAARDMKRFGWAQKVLDIAAPQINSAIRGAIEDPKISTFSLVFRSCKTNSQLLQLIESLRHCDRVFLEQDVVLSEHRCLGFRARIGTERSWITGLGPFPFFPPTRRTPYTELVMRVKPRPSYKKVMKKTPPGVLHAADMDMLGMDDDDFKRMWSSSLKRTAQIIGHTPDLMSAAKTTFVIPTTLAG